MCVFVCVITEARALLGELGHRGVATTRLVDFVVVLVARPILWGVLLFFTTFLPLPTPRHSVLVSVSEI